MNITGTIKTISDQGPIASNLALIVAVVSVIISVATLVMNARISRQQRIIEVVTGNRMKWIQEFRLLIAEFLNLCMINRTGTPIHTEEDIYQHMEEMNICSQKLTLYLNCFGKYDSIILQDIQDIMQAWNIVMNFSLFDRMEEDHNIAILKYMGYLEKLFPKEFDEKFEYYLKKEEMAA